MEKEDNEVETAIDLFPDFDYDDKEEKERLSKQENDNHNGDTKNK